MDHFKSTMMVLILAGLAAPACGDIHADIGAETPGPNGSSGGHDPTLDDERSSEEGRVATSGTESSSTGTDEPPDGNETSSGSAPPCEDGVRNGQESGIDCGGACGPCPPSAWACAPEYYADSVCHCGCGVVDVDCASPYLVSCEVDACPQHAIVDVYSPSECIELPADWSCADEDYGPPFCDCGCGAPDPACEAGGPSSCDDDHCVAPAVVDPNDNAFCLPAPAQSIANPSFEQTPSADDPVPSWSIIEDYATVSVAGPAQTAAPEGSRALYLGAYTTMNAPPGEIPAIGRATIRSTAFMPPQSSACQVTVSVGDSETNSLSDNQFGSVRVVAPSLPEPLDVVAEVELGSAEDWMPPSSGYSEIALQFVADGASLYHVEFSVNSSYGAASYFADDIRIACE